MTHVEFYTYNGGASYNIHTNDGYTDTGINQYAASNPQGGYRYVPLDRLPSASDEAMR